MLQFFKIPAALSVLLLYGLTPAVAQNTVLTTSNALPGGGTGSNSVVVGPGNSYPSATSANDNVFIGAGAGVATTTGSNNSFIGYQAGYRNTTGSGNLFVGFEAGFVNTTGGYNTFMGIQAGYNNTYGDLNSFTGAGAGYRNTTGGNNTFMGISAGYNNTNGSYNTFMGSEAGYGNTTGFNNSSVGFRAGYLNTTGSNNAFTGYESGYLNTTGSNNSFTGYQAGRLNTTGGNNSFMGSFSGTKNTTGSNNAFTGYESGYQNTTGYNNAFTGFRAGYVNATGAFNSFMGSFADATGANKVNLQRATALGYNAKVAVDDGLVLGDTTDVKVGIGTAYPNQRFTLRGNMNFVAYDNSMMLRDQPFLHFNEHESLALGLGAELPADAEKTLVLGSETSQVKVPGRVEIYALTLSEFGNTKTAGQFLTVNQSGKVVMAQPRVQVANVADWSDKVFAPDYKLLPLGEVEAFVKKNKHLPGVPSAEKMVAEGMETVAFNARLLEKIEELTLYVVSLEKKSEEVKTLRNEVAELKLLIQQVKPQTPPR